MSKHKEHIHMYCPKAAVTGKVLLDTFVKHLKKCKNETAVEELRQRLKSVSRVQNITIHRTDNSPPKDTDCLPVPYPYLVGVKEDERVLILFAVVTPAVSARRKIQPAAGNKSASSVDNGTSEQVEMCNVYIVGCSHRMSNATLLADVVHRGHMDSYGNRFDEDHKMVRVLDLYSSIDQVIAMLCDMRCLRKINGELLPDVPRQRRRVLSKPDQTLVELHESQTQLSSSSSSSSSSLSSLAIATRAPVVSSSLWQSNTKEMYNPEPHHLRMLKLHMSNAKFTLSRSALIKMAYKRTAILAVVLEHGAAGAAKAIQVFHDMCHETPPGLQFASQWIVCASACMGEGFDELLKEAEWELVHARFSLLQDKQERLIAFRCNAIELDIDRLHAEFDSDASLMLAFEQNRRLDLALRSIRSKVGRISYGDYLPHDELAHPGIPEKILNGSMEVPEFCFKALCPCIDLWVNASRVRNARQEQASQ